MDQAIKGILTAIDSAISGFQDSIPGIQKLVFEELQPLVRQLEVKNGKLLNNVNNLKLLGSLETRLERIIISANYKKSVQGFIDSFSAVSNLNNEYFKQFNQKFKPKNTLPIIKQLAVESTINDLLGSGLNSNFTSAIKSILQQNITTGGNYAKFNDELSGFITGTDESEGGLQRYTRQITTDAINQYNAQYHDTIGQDLQFNWGRYVGSNLTTTRQFCELLTEKQWVHKSELEKVIHGEIDGEQCKLSKTTRLPLGMMTGTNADNFKVRRGGYNCGHQFFWVPDNAVPQEAKDKLKGIPPVKKVEVPPPPVPRKEGVPVPAGTLVSEMLTQIKPSVKKFVEETFSAIDRLHGDGKLENIPIGTLRSQNANGAFYTFMGKPIKMELRLKGDSPEFTFAHEMGHYLDFQAIGTKGLFDTKQLSGHTAALMKALDNTPAIKAIRDSIKAGFIMRNGEPLSLSPALRHHLEYLLSPHEQFARAYSQFIAKRGGSDRMLQQLRKRQADDNHVSIKHQWPDEEFEEIEKVMEELFKSLGWISQ